MTRETAGSRRDPERVGATVSICAVVTLRAAGVATGPGSVGVVYNRWACAQFNVPSATSQFACEKVSKRRTVPSRCQCRYFREHSVSVRQETNLFC